MEFIPSTDGEVHSYNHGLEWLNSLEDEDILYLFGRKSEIGYPYIPKEQKIYQRHDIIFSGCSETHGDYLSDFRANYSGEDIWGFKVAKYLNKSAVNLGIGGLSIYDIVKNIISVVDKSNKPSYIFCLFPDLNRLTMPNDPRHLIDRIYKRDKVIHSTLATPIGIDHVEPKYSKKPYLKEEVIPKIVPVWMNLRSIQILEKFCSLADITLRYTTWSEQTHGIIESAINLENSHNIETSYPSYINSEAISWGKGPKEFKCSGNHLVDVDKNYKYFDMGRDNKHMGTHRHAHIAEKIIESLTN